MRIEDVIPGNQESEILPALKDYAERNRANQTRITTVESMIAQQKAVNMGRIHRIAPHLEPGVVLALANANASDQMIARAAQAAMSVERAKQEELAEQAKKNRGLFGTVFQKFKTGVRWGVSVGDTGFDLLNQLPSTFISPSDSPQTGDVFDFDLKNPFRKGWWASTALGSMMSGEDSGEGYFIGGDAERLQQQRLNRFAGQLPITIEAGAGENTQYEINPEEIRQLAVQILSQKNVSFEEAYQEAEQTLRENAFIPITFGGTSPLYVPRILTLRTPTGGVVGTGIPDFASFREIGSQEYATTAAMATIALGFASPEPLSKGAKVTKAFTTYSRGIKGIDAAGNFIIDNVNIAQNAAEADFLARVDSLNAVVNDYEVSALRLQDEAIEMATPQPGVWYHGSRTGQIEGNNFFDIGDPRYPTPEGNLYGPGLYITESPTIGQSYARREGATYQIPEADDEILRSIPGAIGDRNLGLGIREDLLEGGEKPAAVYRFIESEDIPQPRLLDMDRPFGVYDDPLFDAPQMTPEEIDTLVDVFIPRDLVSEQPNFLASLIPAGDSLGELFTGLDLKTVLENTRAQIFDGINTVKSYSHNVEFSAGLIREEILLQAEEIAKARPEIFESSTFVAPVVTAKRFYEHVLDFMNEIGRMPTSVDELLDFRNVRSRIDEVFFAPGADSVEFLKNSNIESIAQQLLLKGDDAAYRKPRPLDEYVSALNVYDDYLRVSRRVGGRWSTILEDFSRNPAFDYYGLESVQKFFDTVLLPKIDESFDARVADDAALKELLKTHEGLGAYSKWGFFVFGDVLERLGSRRVPYITINQKLSEMGFDGLTHMGGFVAGAEKPHRVRILFDPMKNLDVTDPLTGERLPINQAINAQRESGELYERAADIRNQIDEMEMMRDAGVLPGYGEMVDPATFNTFFTQSRAGRYAADKIWEVVNRFDAGEGFRTSEAWYELFTMFGGRLPLEDMEEILKATSKSEMIGIINKKVGYTPGLSNIDDLNMGLSKTLDKAKRISRADLLFEKLDDIFGPVLGRSPSSKTLNFFGTEREKLQALQDLDSFITTGVRGEAVGEKATILRKFAEAMMSGDKTDMFRASETLATAIYNRILQETGDATQAQLASDLWKSSFDQATGQGLYQVGADGLRTDNDYAVTLASVGGRETWGLEKMVHGGPGLLSELQRSALELPDVQALRRMTSILGVFTSQQGLQRAIKKSELRTNALKKFGVDLSKKDLEKIGELRIPLRAVDYMMTKVWKNGKKLQFAYSLRNTIEAQARMAFAGKDNVFSHPIDHILVSTFNRIPDDIALGEEFNPGGWRNIGIAHENSGYGYQEMLGGAFFASEGRFDMVNSQFRNGAMDVFSKDRPQRWAQAGGYELRQLFNDPIARKYAQGYDTDAIMRWLYSDAEDGKAALKQISSLMSSGELFYKTDPRLGRIPENVPISATPQNIRIRIEAQQKKRMELKTGGDTELIDVVGSGQFRGAPAFDGAGRPSKELLDYLEENVGSDILPEFYRGPGESVILKNAQKNWFDRSMSFIFDNLVGRMHNQLDRSPLWRQEYTQEINRLAPLLSREAAQEMKNIILERTAFYNDMAQSKKIARTFTVKDYIGKNVDADELMESLDNAAGWMSREELHVIANAITLDRIENLLFDATARNSMTDAARIVSPFNAAFFEVTRKWFSLMAQNPDKAINATRKFGYVAGEKSPEELGPNGIIAKDPVTGEYMYNLPLSGTLFRLFNRIMGGRDTGADFGLRAPISGLNMAFSFSPGVGPVVGYPLGKLMYSSPKLRDYATFFLPYGQPRSPLDPMEYAPGFLSKAISAVTSDPRQAGAYADTLNDVMRAELATGEWNIEDPEEFEQFQKDVEQKASILTMMRAIGQFLGPSAPRLRSEVGVKGGDVMAGFLTAEFHELQAEDYDTAVERFLYIYGDEAFAYMAGKTREVYMGVEASSEFAKWELENSELFDSSYGDIAGFFGPKGSEFDWAAWNYQTNKGRRERIPYTEQIAIAQQIIGLHKYRNLIEAAGPKPNEKQRLFIAAQRAELEKKYPGMVSEASFDVQKFPSQIKMMEQAVADPRLAGNETAIQLKKYLEIRNMYITAAKADFGGWNSEKAKPLKADLRYRATLMIGETPEFARIFERILLRELEN